MNLGRVPRANALLNISGVTPTVTLLVVLKADPIFANTVHININPSITFKKG
jgi:hypothetical protein